MSSLSSANSRRSIVRLTTTLALTLLAWGHVQAQEFAAGTMIPTPVHPNSVAAGDFNEDGIPDLAIPCWSPDLLAIVLGDGQGGGLPPVSFSVGGGGPRFAVVGDFNSDGHLDVATPNSYSHDVSIMLGDGTGSMALVQRIPVGLVPFHLAIGDLNDDGHSDLVVANSGANSVSVLLGNGVGGFVVNGTYTVGTEPRGVCLGDFNGDGILDIAASGFGSGNITRWLGNGDGTFSTAASYSVGVNPYKLDSGDFNGDGRADLAVPNFGSATVSILLADPVLGFVTVATLPVGGSPRTVMCRDLDGDSLLDLAVANYGDNSVSVVRGEGAGTFSFAVRQGVGSGPFSLCAVDLNLDGQLDLAVADRDGHTVSLLTGVGGLRFSAPSTAYVGRSPRGVAVADVNGDGWMDMAVPNYSDGTVSLLLGSSSGEVGIAFSLPVRSGPAGAAFADLNSDGHLDLVVANSSNNSISVLLGDGNGGFAPGVKWNAGSSPRAVLIADFNSDGIPDLATPNYSGGTVSILRGIGGGSYAAQVQYATGGGSTDATVGDVNHDGHLDLVVCNAGAGTIAVLLGNGSGAFAPAMTFACGVSPSAVALQDFDQDGILDVVVANETANTVTVLRGSGSGAFQAPSALPTGTRPLGLVVGDVTGDGLPDLVVAAATSERIAVHPGLGNGSFAPYLALPAGDFSRAVALGDFNGDSKPDIAVANANGNDVWVLLSRGGTSADLSISLDDGTLSVNPGTAASYSVTVGNAGPDALSSITLSLILPPELESVSWTPSAGLFDPDTGIWDGLTLDSDASVTLTVAGTVSSAASGLLTFEVSVEPSAGTVDPVLANNSAVDTNSIILGDADLAVAISNDQTSANAGDPLTYTVAVGNVGPIDVAQAAIAVELPSQLLGVSWTSSVSGGASAPSSGTGTLAGTVDLPVGGMAVFTFTGTVDPLAASGTLVAFASIQAPADVIDPETGNNEAADVDALTGNTPPIADPQTISLEEDGQAAITLSGSDADGDPLTFSLVQAPGNGVLSGTLPALTYTPAANFTGNDAFVFSVSDGIHSGSATVSLVVNPANDTPTANSFSVTTDEDVPLSLALTGSDLDGDNLSFVILTSPVLGTLSGSAPSLSFVPTANISGTDSFTYAVSDGIVQSPPATVTIEITAVNDVPTVVVPVVDPTVNGEDTSLILDLAGRFSDVETPAANLTLSVVSGNPSLVTPVLSGTQLELQLAAGLNGSTTVTVRATDAEGAFAENAFVVTIIRPGVHLSVSDASATEGSSAGVVFTLTLSAPSDQPVTVTYATADLSALSGVDYTAATGTVTFNPGVTTRTVKVTTVGDVLDESDETFQLGLTDVVGAIVDGGTAVGTIVDNDTSALAVQNVSVTEGNAGVTSATFTVTLSTPNAQDVSVNFDTANISAGAVAGMDYTARSGTLVFPAGSNASQTVIVDIIGDTTDETNEGFDFRLSNPVNASFSRQNARATIVDDDLPPTVSIADASVVEGNSGTKALTFTVTLSAASQLSTRIRYQTADGSAIAGSDYTAGSGELYFAAGITSRTVSIAITGNTEAEADETFFVNLHTPANLTIGDGQAIGLILDDDTAP